MLGFSEHLVHWSLPLLESPQSPSFRLLRETSPSIPLNPGHSGFSGLCICNSLHGWVLSCFDHRLQNGTLNSRGKRSPDRGCAYLLPWERQFLSIFTCSYRSREKKSQIINISINYPATFVYPLNVGTVYLPFKLLRSSVERSVLSYKIYHCGITCGCSSGNVMLLI